MSQRFTFRSLPPEYRDLQRWRSVDSDALPEDEKARFDRLKVAIETYVRTGKLSVASRESGYSEALIIKQLNRCTLLAEDGLMLGWAGLLKGVRVKAYRRKAPMPVAAMGAASGFSGCFSRFLEEHEAIRLALDALILKRGKKQPHEACISIKKLALMLRDLCREHGIRENEYPLNVASYARRSIARYVEWLVRHNVAKGTLSRYGVAAQRRLSVGTGESGIVTAWAPYDVAGLDAHEEHCIGCVIVPGPAGPQRVAIERLWVNCLVDKISRAILGYSVGIRTEVSSATVEEALISAISPWRPRALTIPALRYRDGGGLPSGVIPALAGCAPAILIVDNAAAHFAKRIAESARKRLGCAVTFGSVGHWEHNAVVERLFKTLETYGFQRLPSTTGSNTADSTKDKPITKAIELGITWEALLDLTDVLVADYNATKNRGLGDQSPLQVLVNHLELVGPLFLPRALPPATVNQPDLGIVVETRYVRGNQRHGRRPYVEVDRVRYTSPILARSFGLIGKHIRLHIREANMCSFNAYLESGQELGTLSAQGGWGKTPHTREMRKQIWSLFDAGELALAPGEDPVQKLLEILAARAYRDASKRPRSTSRAGTKLANAANVSGLPIPAARPEQPAGESSVGGHVQGRPIPSTIKSPVWKSVT